MVNVTDIFYFLGKEIIVKIRGNQRRSVKSVAPIDEANIEQLSFVYRTDKKALEWIENSRAGVIICHEKFKDHSFNLKNKALIFTSNPRLHFIKLTKKFFIPLKIQRIPIESKIHSSAVIGDNVKIGEGTEIHANVVIYDDVIIGKNCIIQAGVVIGSTGFGYEKDDDGTWIKFPHLKRVIIGNNVEIGANTCVDRGGLRDTIIEDGVKIDNLCHIAHNIKIGKNSLIIALAMIGGSTKIGEDCWIAPSACLRDNIVIGEKAFVGLGAVVLRDVPPNTIVVGNPAKPLRKRETHIKELDRGEKVER